VKIRLVHIPTGVFVEGEGRSRFLLEKVLYEELQKKLI